MLSGKVPFQLSNDPGSAVSVMQRIQDGQFNLTGPEWAEVSPQAKQLIQGMCMCSALRISEYCYLWILTS